MIAVAVVSLVLSILPHNVLKGTLLRMHQHASLSRTFSYGAFLLDNAGLFAVFDGCRTIAGSDFRRAVRAMLYHSRARSFALPSRERSCNGVHCCGLFCSIELVLDVSLCHSPCGAVYLALRTIAVLYFTEPSKCSCDISFPAESCGSFLES